MEVIKIESTPKEIANFIQTTHFEIQTMLQIPPRQFLHASHSVNRTIHLRFQY